MALLAGGYSGVPRYVVEVVRAIDRVAAEFPTCEFHVFTTRRGLERIQPANLSASVVSGVPGVDKGPVRLITEQLGAVSQQADLLHFMDFIGPLLRPRRAFTATVYDMKIIDVPAAYSRGRLAYKRRVIPWTAQRAQALLAISEEAKRQTVHHCGTEPGKLRVVLAGPGFSGEGRGRIAPAGIDAPFWLHVGQLSASKNLPFLVHAFGATKPPARLVLAGRPVLGFHALQAAVAASPARERIDVLADVSDARLEGLYREAIALIMPSLYEGFGFTPLEAMARCCPVLASRIPAFEEIAGDGALLLPLGDPRRWSEGMERVREDASFRNRLIEAGSRRVAEFSWDAAGRGTCAVLAEVAEGIRG